MHLCKGSSNSKEKMKGDGQASFHCVTIGNVDNLKDGIELPQASESSQNTEGFEHGSANKPNMFTIKFKKKNSSPEKVQTVNSKKHKITTKYTPSPQDYKL